MSRLPTWQQQLRQGLIDNADFFFPFSGVWQRQQNGTIREVGCRFGVSDPDRLSRGEIERLLTLASGDGYSYADLRVVKVHPDDPALSAGMVLAGVYDGGRLEIVARSAAGKLSLQRTYTAVIRRGTT